MTQAVAAALLAALLLLAAVPAYASTPSRHVVVVLAPYLTWDDIMSGPMPQTRLAVSQGLIANANVRSTLIGAGQATPDSGALMLSTGASVLYDPAGLPALDTSEASLVSGLAFPSTPGTGGVLYEGRSAQVATNASDPSLVPGILASTVRGTGALIAAFGNSDPGARVSLARMSRPAGIAAADEKGLVELGDVGRAMLTMDPAAPFGVRTDVVRLGSALRDALSAGTAFVVLDPGDLGRAHAADSGRLPALKTLDSVVGLAHNALGPNDTLIVLAQVEEGSGGSPSGFGPLVLCGPLGAGLATSASTHRDGLVTLPDVSATIVDAFGAAPPAGMTGALIARSSLFAGAPADTRIAYVREVDSAAVAVETVRLPLLNWYIVLVLVALVGGAIAVFARMTGTARRIPEVARAIVLLVMCVPLAAIVQFAIVQWPSSPTLVVVLLVACTLVIWMGAMIAGRGGPSARPLALVAAATALVVTVDQWLGAPFSLVSIFGYSPLLGSRYYGLGNEMAALLLGCTFLAVALTIDMAPGSRWAAGMRAWGWPVVGAAVLVTAAAPMLGANVGPAAWMTMGVLVGWLMLNGRKVWTWRNAVIALLLVMLIVGALAAVDILRGAGAETHLGRALTGAGGGVAALWTIFVRKAATNVRVLGRTNWTWVCLAVLLLLGYMRWRPRGEFAAMLAEHPAFSASLGAGLFAGVVGYLTEDSGIIIPALVLLPLAMGTLYLMSGRGSTAGGERR
jgi:hypothetical protein